MKRMTVVVLGVAALVCGASPARAAGVASALVRQGDVLPGAPAGETVFTVDNTAVNHVGGYAVTLATTGAPSTKSYVWGNATGGAGAVLVAEGTYGIYQQDSHEAFFGMANNGDVGYSAMLTDTLGGGTSLDSVWVNTTPILVEDTPVPTLPGSFSTFNSRAGMTADGNIYWVGGYTNTPGGATQNRVLFYGAGATVVLKGGDTIPGVPEALVTGAGGIAFDVRYSALGSHFIDEVLVNATSTIDGVVVIDGSPAMSGGAIVREGSPVPLASGGLAGENWDSFDFVGINEAGDWMLTGDTTAAAAQDEFIAKNGSILYREGQAVADGIYDGTIEGAYMNENGDIAYIWDITASAVNEEALFLNGGLVLREGDLVDWNGDGVIDGADGGGVVSDFTGISSLTLGDRSGAQTVDILFTADIAFASVILEGAFRQTVSVDVDVIPEPAGLGLIGLALIGLRRRSRR